MATIVLRNVKGTPLTFSELDDNFSNLNTELGTKGDVGSILGSSTSGSGQINWTNLASADARTLAAASTDLTSLDSVGDIRTVIENNYPGAFTTDQKSAIEYALRPLYCALSVLLKNLDDQGIA